MATTNGGFSPEQATLLGFLAGYWGFTHGAYLDHNTPRHPSDGGAADRRQFAAWCWRHDRRLFDGPPR